MLLTDFSQLGKPLEVLVKFSLTMVLLNISKIRQPPVTSSVAFIRHEKAHLTEKIVLRIEFEDYKKIFFESLDPVSVHFKAMF